MSFSFVSRCCVLICGVLLFAGCFVDAQDLWQDYQRGECGDSTGLFAECVVDNIVGQENEKTGIIQTKLDNTDSNV